jgi:hypothetical protein
MEALELAEDPLRLKCVLARVAEAQLTSFAVQMGEAAPAFKKSIFIIEILDCTFDAVPS